ncbi:hypothetical protein pb186bvf_002253 [Paramecium bursaria]
MIKNCIIGAGPVGLTLGILFKRLNIPFQIYEQKSSLQSHPSAHYVNMRSMEILEQLGIKIPMEDFENFKNYSYLRRIGDQPILKTNQFIDFKNYAMTSYAHIPQNILVKHLYSEIKEHVIFDHQLIELRQDQQIQIKLRSKDNHKTIQCERLFGCDGYNGFVRQALGIKMKGQQDIQNFINIHFISQELIKQTNKYESMLHFIYNSNLVGVLIKHSIQNGEFALQIPLDVLINRQDPAQIQQITKDTALINRLINGLTNKNLTDITIKSVGLWKMSAVVAEKYYDKNCILVGDACHSMPPAGGFGMNTGIQDAYNLAFKIQDNVDLVHYESERKQIAQQNISTAMKYYQVSLDIAKQLGFSYSLLKNYQSITNFLPFIGQFYQHGIKFGSSFIENDFIYNKLRIDKQIPLVFPNEDIGYKYTTGDFQFGQSKNVGKLVPLEIRKLLQPFKWYSVNHHTDGMEQINLNTEQKLIIRPDQHIYKEF